MNLGKFSVDSKQGEKTRAGLQPASGISTETIRMQLDRILASHGFVHSDRMARFLRFAVEQTIQGQADQLKESVIGMEVFDKTSSFDPRIDTIVRVEARRLRSKLKQYYEIEGREDFIMIDLPKGSYVPTFLARRTEEPQTGTQLESLSGSDSVRPSSKSRYRLRLTGAVLGIVLVVAGAGITLWLTRTQAPNAQPVLRRLTTDTGLTYQPSLSPDGKLVAYASDRSGEGNLDIWKKQVAGGEPVRLTNHPADDHEPAFSADGSRIAFRSERDGGGIYVISAIGGNERLIASQGLNPQFSPDGRYIAFKSRISGSGVVQGKIYVVASTGGPPPRQLQPEFAHADHPVWSPDGKYLLFAGSPERPPLTPGGSPFEWWVTPLDGGAAVPTGASGLLRSHGLSRGLSPESWVAGQKGHTITFSAGLEDTSNLWQVGISPNSWQLTGTPQRLTFGTGLDVAPSLTANGGLLVFASLVSNADIWSLPIEANKGKILGEPRPLVQGAAADLNPSLSADGIKLAFNSNRSGHPDVWIKNLKTGREIALTDGPLREGRVHLSPDGSKVAYQTNESGQEDFYMMAWGGGPAQKICENCGGSMLGWSANGTEILYYWGQPIRFGLLNVVTGKKRVVLQHPHYDLNRGQISPDERWIAFHVPIDARRSPVFLAPLRQEGVPGERDWIHVTDGSGVDYWPFWSPKGNLLYYLSDRDGFRCVWAQPLDVVTKRPIGSPTDVYHIHSARRSLLNLSRLGNLGMSLTHDQLVFSMGEITGNIWSVELGRQ